MQQVLKNTYKTICNNWQIFLLFLISSVFFARLNFFPLINSLYLIVAQLFLYIFLLRPNDFYKLKDFKFVLKFILSVVLLSFCFLLISKFFSKLLIYLYLTLALEYKDAFELIFRSEDNLALAIFIPNALTIFYFVTRIGVIFPMLVMEDRLSLKKIYIISNSPYWQWLLLSVVFFFPIIYFYNEGRSFLALYMSTITLLQCCFYSCYYLYKRQEL